MATYASIKYDMDLSSNATGTGGMTLLSTQTASSSATVDFTSSIDSTYKEYLFKCVNLHPATDEVSLQFQVDTGTNTNYNQTITSSVLITSVCFIPISFESGEITPVATKIAPIPKTIIKSIESLYFIIILLLLYNLKNMYDLGCCGYLTF